MYTWTMDKWTLCSSSKNHCSLPTHVSRPHTHPHAQTFNHPVFLIASSMHTGCDQKLEMGRPGNKTSVCGYSYIQLVLMVWMDSTECHELQNVVDPALFPGSFSSTCFQKKLHLDIRVGLAHWVVVIPWGEAIVMRDVQEGQLKHEHPLYKG